jgi:ribosomal protein S18 acetylase RimI-like enzyme
MTAGCEKTVNKDLSFALRAATEADSGFLWYLTTTTMRDYVAAVGVWDEVWQEQKFRSQYVASKWQIIVVGGSRAGGICLDRNGSAIYVTDIQILPEYQRRGIGSTVLRDLIADAAARDVPLALSVLRSNPDARRLYERLGFSAVSLWPTPDYVLMAIPAPPRKTHSDETPSSA